VSNPKLRHIEHFILILKILVSSSCSQVCNTDTMKKNNRKNKRSCIRMLLLGHCTSARILLLSLVTVVYPLRWSDHHRRSFQCLVLIPPGIPVKVITTDHGGAGIRPIEVGVITRIIPPSCFIACGTVSFISVVILIFC
jgi:hypothetical protein